MAASGPIGKADSVGEFLAKPPGACCLTGSLHDGTPQGTFETLATVETYVSRPPPGNDNGNVVLYFPDVWGMFTNGLLVMDAFASAGYVVLGLDYFREDPVWKHRKDRHDTSNPGFDYEAWLAKHQAVADQLVPTWVDSVKEKYGREETKYACVGYW